MSRIQKKHIRQKTEKVKAYAKSSSENKMLVEHMTESTKNSILRLGKQCQLMVLQIKQFQKEHNHGGVV